MPNKKINQLDAKTAVSTDLMLVGDPTNGTAYKSTLANLPLVPNSRTLTINGVSFDLSTNRAWTITSGISSLGLSMPSAFAVANSPITSSGTLAVTALGSASQYIRGDGALATFPGTASGGSAVSYYLNGGTSASVATYFQMSKTAVLGAAADFNLVGNGLIAQFLTDVADPNRLEIPAGNWNFELYFNISSSGGNTAFYVELLKYNGSTFTSIASSVGTPEAITGGTLIDLYLTSLAIPQTTLLASDRLALRVYIVSNSGGRTVTLHTQNGHLCEIITNFAGGVSALNGITANTQYFATGTSGTNFGIVSSGDTHTFNLPTASATNRGALSSADWSTFNNKVPTSRTLTINGTTYDLSADRSWTIPSSNIYNADGTLTGNRLITLGGKTLTFKETTSTLNSALVVANNGTESLNLINVGSDYSITGWRNNSVLASSKSLLFVSDTNSASGGSSTFKFIPGGYNVVEQLTIGNGYSTFNNVSGSYDLTINTGITNGQSQILFKSSTSVNNGFVVSTAPSFAYGTLIGKETTLGSYGVVSLRSNDTGYIRFMTGNADPAFSTEKARITAAGRLLLGTITESTFILDAVGTARISDRLTITTNGAQIKSSSILFFEVLDSNGQRTFMSGGESAGGIAVGNSGLSSSSGRWVSLILGTGVTNAYGGLRFHNINDQSVTVGRMGFFGNSQLWVQTNANDVAAQLALIASSSTLYLGYYTYNTLPASAALAIQSTTQGFLPPRMTTTERNAIASPATGLVVYDTTQNSLNVYDGATWRSDEDTITTNRQTASYSLVLADRGKLVEMNSASANTLTIPLNSSIAFPIGSKIDVTQYGAGATTITAASGVTIRSFTSFLKIAGQYAACTLVKIGTDEWYAYGNLIA